MAQALARKPRKPDLDIDELLRNAQAASEFLKALSHEARLVILCLLIEGEKSVDALVAEGFDRPTVLRVWKLLDRAEYKRRQAPPGVKITARAFGRDRRYPITNGFTALVK